MRSEKQAKPSGKPLTTMTDAINLDNMTNSAETEITNFTKPTFTSTLTQTRKACFCISLQLNLLMCEAINEAGPHAPTLNEQNQH